MSLPNLVPKLPEWKWTFLVDCEFLRLSGCHTFFRVSVAGDSEEQGHADGDQLLHRQPRRRRRHRRNLRDPLPVPGGPAAALGSARGACTNTNHLVGLHSRLLAGKFPAAILELRPGQESCPECPFDVQHEFVCCAEISSGHRSLC